MKCKKLVIIVSFLTIAFLVLAGCSGMGNDENNMDMNRQDRVGQNDADYQRQNAEGIDNGLMRENVDEMDDIIGMDENGANNAGMENNNMLGNAADDRQKCQIIGRNLDKMDGVNNCSVVKSGDTVLVGCDPIKNAGSKQNVMKEIEQKVKQMDPSVKNVAVTDSKNLLNQIRQMSGQMSTDNNMDLKGKMNQLMQQIKR